MKLSPSVRAITASAGLALASAAHGQASYVESFDDLVSGGGVSSLQSRGWEFRNQSNPIGSGGFFGGFQGGGHPAPQSGAGYLAVDGNVTNSLSGGQMSAWAILPPVQNQIAGDMVTAWVYGSSGGAGLEVRYSPSGGTGTGAGVSGVGDFTQVLVSSSPVPIGQWTRLQATAPGSGRIALRYFGTHGGIGSFNPYLGIDTLSVGPPPPPACNQPPLPQPGQTVTWTLANSPYTVCENISIPAGGTVQVQAGVTINIQSQRQITIAGTMNVLGTAAAPVTFAAPGIFPPFIKIQNGTLDAHFASFGQQVRVGAGANVLLRDCIFTGDGTNLQGGMLTSDALYDSAVPYVLLERCTFTQSLCVLSDCLAVLRNTTFNDSTAWLLRGYADVTEPNTFSGKPLEITREEPIQHALVSGVTATNVNDGAGLRLSGGNWLLGPSGTGGVQLSGNDYPLQLEGGLLRGSMVTPTGNNHNAIDVGSASFAGDARWSPMGIPYRLTGHGGGGGTLRIDPGVIVEGLPGAGIYISGGRRFIARGMPQQPITFQPAFPGQNWFGIVFDTAFHGHPHLENCIFRSAQQAIVGVDTVTVRVDHCRFENNVLGTSGNFNTQIALGKSLFTGNGIGARRNSYLLNFTNPNAFENNTIAVEGVAGGETHAELCWWNSPSGPSNHPQVPGGGGDPIGGAAGNVWVIPFLTERPNFADTPPVVRVQDPGIRGASVLDPGEKMILHWDAQDDAGIVSQTVTVLGGEGGPITIAENIPGMQRSLEFTVPSVGFDVVNTPQRVRVDAFDSAGQIGSEQFLTLIPSGRLAGELAFTQQTLSAYVGQTFTAGQPIINPTWTGSVSQFPSYDVYLVLDADQWYIPGVAIGQSGFFNRQFPHASTDLARLALRARNNSNDQMWFYSGYFSIRHDPRLGFQPPQVQLAAPANGAQFAGGSTVLISWTASASQGLYSFDLQASYDGGRDWNTIARELPASATSYSWQLPPSTGIPDVRLRTIARDRRGQNSSSGMDRIFSITPGSGPGPCYANCDHSTTAPVLNVADFGCFLQKFAAGDPWANCDQSTTPPVLNVADFGCFLQQFAAGCP